MNGLPGLQANNSLSRGGLSKPSGAARVGEVVQQRCSRAQAGYVSGGVQGMLLNVAAMSKVSMPASFVYVKGPSCNDVHFARLTSPYFQTSIPRAKRLSYLQNG